MPDRDQTIDLLSALRDVDVTPPSTEVLHARVSAAIAQEIERDSERPLGRLAGLRRRVAFPSLMSSLVPIVAVTLTLVIFIGAIVLLAGHQQPRSSAAPKAPTTRQSLLAVLGVLRRPQTRADLHSPVIAQYLQHPDDEGLAALNGTPDLALIRLATVTPWGSPVYLAPNKPPTAAALARLQRQFPTLPRWRLKAARREEGVTEVDRSSSGGDATAAAIEAGQAIGTEGAGRSFAGGATQTRVIAIVPDGVAKVSFVDPQPPPHRPGATVTVPVHGNVAAAQLNRGGTGGSVPIPMIWLSSTGAVIKRIGETRTLNQAMSQFAALRRPRTRADAIPAITLRLLRQPIKELHADANLSRRVFASPTATVWLLPALVRGRPGICIFTQQRVGTGGGGGASCEQTKPAPAGIFIQSMGGLRIESVLTLGTDLRVTLEDGHSYTLRPNADGAVMRTFPRLNRRITFVAR